MSDKETCLTCVWCKNGGNNNVGCFYNGVYVQWLSKKSVSKFPVCMVEGLTSAKLKEVGAKYGESYK